MGRLFLLFTLGSMTELYLLIRIGRAIGPLNTILLIVVTGFVGSYFARREGARVLAQIGRDIEAGRVPTLSLLDAALVFVGGILMITPGVISDLVGLLLVVPATRALVRGPAMRWFRAHFRTSRSDVCPTTSPPDAIDANSEVISTEIEGASK